MLVGHVDTTVNHAALTSAMQILKFNITSMVVLRLMLDQGGNKQQVLVICSYANMMTPILSSHLEH